MSLRRLYFWRGPVAASKTTGALGMARRMKRLGRPVVLLRPKSSSRGHEKNGTLVTKDGAAFPAVELESADDIIQQSFCQDTVVWIDEPALFGEPLYAAVKHLRKRHDVLVSGISQTGDGKPFGIDTAKLLAVADRIFDCVADCDFCGRLDSATRSLYVGHAPLEGDVHVGGEESWRPACPDCWQHLNELDPEDRRAAIRAVVSLL